jgi:hypothetical protein
MQFTLPLLTLLLASASALAEPLSQNAAARAALVARETGVFAPQYGLARRSLELTGGRKMHARRRPSTAAQREAQAKLNAYADNQAAINTKVRMSGHTEVVCTVVAGSRVHVAAASHGGCLQLASCRSCITLWMKAARRRRINRHASAAAHAPHCADTPHPQWQAAAMESLKAGKTPQTFDEFANGQAAGSASASTPAPAADTSSNDDSNDDDSNDDDDSSDDSDDEQQAAVSNSDASADDCDTDASGQEDSKPAAAAAPVVKAKEKPAPKQDAQPKQEAPKQEAPKQEAPKQDTPKQTSNNNNNNSNSGASNSGGSGDKTGEMTYYATGLGACGWTNKDSDFITAVAASLYDSFGLSNGSKVCGRKVKIFYGGKSITATVVDRCVGCAQNDLDLSPSAFSALASQDIGRTKMTWTWA